MPGGAVSWLRGLVVVSLLPPAYALAPLVAADGTALGAGWGVVGLPKQKPPLTRFDAVRIDGRHALRVRAEASYGNLVHELPAGAAPRRIAWAWRLEVPNTAADLSRKTGDDTAVRVCMSFDLPLAQLPFFERQRLQLARTVSGERLPAATLCWVWAPNEEPGRVIANAYSARVRYLVLRGRGEATGGWAAESRDVAADFRRAFGDESTTVPAATAVAVAGDADNTGASSLAYVADLEVEGLP